MDSNRKKKRVGNVERKARKVGDKNRGRNEDELDKRNKKSSEEMSSLDKTIIAGFSVFVGAVYIYTMYPSIAGGDSGELIAAAHELGVAHPPGYPLFTMLAWLNLNLIPFGNVAWRTNLLNAVFASLAAFFFILTIYRYTRSAGCALFGTSAWAFCKLTWTWSSNAEVFGLNNFFITSLLYLMIVFQDAEEQHKEKIAYFGAFYCGLALCNQHTIVVYVIVVGAWVLLELRSLQKLQLSTLFRIGLCFLCGMVPYIYLPISAMIRPGRWTWGDQTTLEGFIKHFLRQEYGTFDLAKNPEGSEQGIVFNLNKYFIHIRSEFTILGLGLCLVGIYVAWCRLTKEGKKSLLVSFGMALLYLMFFSWRANLDMTNELFVGVVERFWMQCDVILVLLAAAGFNFVLRILETKLGSINMNICSLSVALLMLAFQIGRNQQYCNQRNNRIVEEFGHRLMYNMPNNTLLLQVGDLSSNLLRYQYLCDKLRPDLSVLDVEIMTYSWAVPMWRKGYSKVIFPGANFYKYDYKTPEGETIFSFKTFLNANFHRPIITCISMKTHEYILQQGFELLPFGPCSLVLKSPVHLEKDYYQYIDLAQNISDGWSHKFELQDPTTWERVAAGEMWNAKVNIPLALYYRAEKEQNPIIKVKIMTKAYKLYKSVIEMLAVEDTPSYYHKNFALCADKMLSLQHDLPKSVILDEIIKHFELFVYKEPNDRDTPAIKQAIQTFKKHVGKF